jgi:hypothetical protein
MPSLCIHMSLIHPTTPLGGRCAFPPKITDYLLQNEMFCMHRESQSARSSHELS